MSQVWKDKTVLLTGHTGFKGSWLALWLSSLGARVHGCALDPLTQPSLFEVGRVSGALQSDHRVDIRELTKLKEVVRKVQPEVVFHLAAQALVRESYAAPVETTASNVMGTVHLLEALRDTERLRAVVVVTTDKVYDNREWPHPYREVDPLGGKDIYSASKAATEIMAAAYRASFYSSKEVYLATARAGNVIGGGDWAKDRLVPDCLRAFAAGEPVRLRCPAAVRPWQHVLEPLAGYLRLAEKLLSPEAARFATSWNFGPGQWGDATVGEVATRLAELWGPGAEVQLDEGEHPAEAGMLRLDIHRSLDRLGWRPRWSLPEALGATVDWYRRFLDGDTVMEEMTRRQILEYSRE